MGQERKHEANWERACRGAVATGFAGFDRIPHELIAALAIVRLAAFTAQSKGRSSKWIDGCLALIAGDHAHHFPLSLWQCGQGDLFDEALSLLATGSEKGAQTLRGALAWDRAVPLSLSLAQCQALSKHLAVKWQILRLTTETKAALAKGQLGEIFQSHSQALDRAWEVICQAALPLYQLDIEEGAFASRFCRSLTDHMGVSFTIGQSDESIGEKIAKLTYSLRLAAELLLDMGGQVRLLQKSAHLTGNSESEDHYARLSSLLSTVCGDLHAVELGLLTAEGKLYPASAAQLLHAISLLAEGALIFADRWLMPLAIC